MRVLVQALLIAALLPACSIGDRIGRYQDKHAEYMAERCIIVCYLSEDVRRATKTKVNEILDAKDRPEIEYDGCNCRATEE